MANIKEEAMRILERLPEDATWDDLLREFYVRKAIETGRADELAGRTRSVQEVRERYGLDP